MDSRLPFIALSISITTVLELSLSACNIRTILDNHKMLCYTQTSFKSITIKTFFNVNYGPNKSHYIGH